MPQIRKECEITLEHPSYVKLYEILKKYEEPHLRDIFLQQVAYNCAIRAVALDFDLSITDPKNTDCLFANHQNLSGYGLETYSDYICVPDYDDAIAQFDAFWLNLFYPFFDEIKEKKKYNHSKPDKFELYPKVQKPLTKHQRELLAEILETQHNDELVLPLFEQKKHLPNELRQGNEHISYNALHITKAFYYFDANHFYRYTQSMIERSLNFPSEKTNLAKHDNRYIKRYLKVITPYILEKKYFDLI